MHGVFEEEAQRALVAARDAATSASRAKSLFVANVSHEIRTPMTAILGYTDILAEPELTESERRDAIETLRRNGHHLLALINDMLDLSKIEAGGLEIRRSETSPISVAQHVVALLRERARAKGLLLDLELAADVPELIHTDALRLQQILVNLVGNAIKFTEQGGVRLAVSRDPEQGLRAERLRFEVTDRIASRRPTTGACSRCPQADLSESRRHGGTGPGPRSRAAWRTGSAGARAAASPAAGSTFRLLFQSASGAACPLRMPPR
jgi:signal transduction histidine kinase